MTYQGGYAWKDKLCRCGHRAEHHHSEPGHLNMKDPQTFKAWPCSWCSCEDFDKTGFYADATAGEDK